MIFINVSNHPSTRWDAEQMAAAGGHVVDVPFPNVPPEATEEEVAAIAAAVVEAVGNVNYNFWQSLPKDEYERAATSASRAPTQVLVQGEFSLCAELWPRLADYGFTPVVATSERQSVDLGDGKKAAVFKFVKFRRVRV